MSLTATASEPFQELGKRDMATVIRDPMDLLTSVDMVNTGGSAYKDSDKRVLASWPADANAPQLSTGGAGHTTFARWYRPAESDIYEFSPSGVMPDHRALIPIRPCNSEFRIGGRRVFNKYMSPGDVALSGPIYATRNCIHKGELDMFLISLPPTLLSEAAETLDGRGLSTDIILFDAHTTQDAISNNLLMACFFATQDYSPANSLQLESLGLALAIHLVGQYRNRERKSSFPKQSPLATWRLNRVTDYIESNLNKSLCLSELSAIAGLSRMHFAAQFKIATGLSPHYYVMKRRVIAAQSLLLSGTLTVQQIAIALGFSSASHLIRHFRQIIGVPPGRWREEMARTKPRC